MRRAGHLSVAGQALQHGSQLGGRAHGGAGDTGAGGQPRRKRCLTHRGRFGRKTSGNAVCVGRLSLVCRPADKMPSIQGQIMPSNVACNIDQIFYHQSQQLYSYAKQNISN